MAFKTASLISPAMFRKYMSPGYKKVNGFLREHGIEVDGAPGLVLKLTRCAVCIWFLLLLAGQDPHPGRKIMLHYRLHSMMSGCYYHG